MNDTSIHSFQDVHHAISLKPNSSGRVLFHSHITGKASTSEMRKIREIVPKIVTTMVEMLVMSYFILVMIEVIEEEGNDCLPGLAVFVVQSKEPMIHIR